MLFEKTGVMVLRLDPVARSFGVLCKFECILKTSQVQCTFIPSGGKEQIIISVYFVYNIESTVNLGC